MLQQQQQDQGKTDACLVPVKHECFDTSTAACNNLAINCEGRYSSSCSADASCHSEPHAAVSPDSCSTMYTPTYSSSTSYGPAASPCFNNSGGQDLSPIIRTARGAITAAAAAVSTTSMGPRFQAVAPGAVLEPPWRSAGHAAAYTLSTRPTSTSDRFLKVNSASRDDWLGPERAEPYWQQERKRPAAFSFGVHALLTPTGQETAAPEALADAAYAVAAMGGVHPDERAKVAKRLAVAAVHTAKTELAVLAAVSGQNQVRVPADACGHVGWPFRSFTTVGRAVPVPISRPAVSQVPAAILPGAAACMAGSAAAPSTSAPCMEQQQQNPDALQDQAAAWAASNAFAAPAANTNNNWVVGAFGIAGPDCSYWQQHQQEMAGFKGWEPALAGTVLAQPMHMLQQGMPYEQPHQGYCAQAADPCDVYAAYYDYYQQIEVPECPPSPQLNGVDYLSDQCTVVCYSNTWKRTAEEAFGAGA